MKSILDRLDASNIDLLLDSLTSSGDVEEAVAIVQEKGIVISRTKAYNIWRDTVDLLNRSESDLNSQKVACSELQIDEMNQPFENFDHYWILTVIDTASRTWLVGYVSKSRDEDASLKTLNFVTKRCSGYFGKRVRCDGHRPHILNIKRIGMIPDARTKMKDFGWINLIERLHRFARSKALKKRKKFRSLKTLQLTVDLIRHHYNGLKPHSFLNGQTPIQHIFGLRFSRWSDWILYLEAIAPRPKAKLWGVGEGGKWSSTASGHLGQTILDGFAQPTLTVASSYS